VFPILQIRLHLLGDVQGVSFRSYLKQTAAALGLKGWVRNQEDGSILAVAQGKDKKALEEFVACAKRGPYFARVLKIKVKWEKPEGECEGFEVRY
jgi:acylphosphatase